MPDRKWALIASGETFEALATTLIFFEDAKAALFGRRGKDGGQDARSGDRARVFQAKHHVDGSAAKAIADAKAEAAKITQYRTPGHSRYEQWKGVTHWRLVTNAAFNPTDLQAWTDEVVPLFTALGLDADYWERANLDALLDRHPEVDRAFFENETRAFLSMPEVLDRLPAQEPFLRRSDVGKFFGRQDEITQVEDFLLSEELFLVLHGAGGTGKTRLLLEAGEQIAARGDWQVLWANVASMSGSGGWLNAVVPERPTLLLVDEPADEELLQQLSEQLGGRVGRTSQWKVAVAVRSPKDPVLRFLFGPRMKHRVREVTLAVLPESDAEAMCGDLLSAGPLGVWSSEQRSSAARELARRFERHPVWLTLAVHVMERRGDLSSVPQTAETLADSYLEEIIGEQKQHPRDELLSILRWVGLLGTINRNDDTTISVIGAGAGLQDLAEVRSRLVGLVDRRALVERGARNRLVEIKPDVFRDHILLKWLTTPVGSRPTSLVASAAAKQLVGSVRDAVLQGRLDAIVRAILLAVGRTELLLRLSELDVALLDDFFDSVKQAVPTMRASARIALAEALVITAGLRPIETAEIISTMRSHEAETETIDTIFRMRTVSHDDVMLELAWPLFHAAMGAQTPDEQRCVFAELYALVNAEAEIAKRSGGLPNDGKRAAALVERALEGGPQFWGEFDERGRELAGVLLDRVRESPPTVGDRALFKALIQPLVAVERQQTWSDDRTIHMQSYALGPDQPAWNVRRDVLKQIMALLEDAAVPDETRAALWKVFAEAHRSANQARRRVEDDERSPYREILLQDLEWAHQVLSARQSEPKVLAAARDTWDWHFRFDDDDELKAISSRLESLYSEGDLTREFEPLLGHDGWEERDAREAEKAASLAQLTTVEEIEAFLDRAVQFVGTEDAPVRLLALAWCLGSHATSQAVVRAFVARSLAAPTVSPRTQFGTYVAAGWVAAVRKGEHATEAHQLMAQLLKDCATDEQRVNLLTQLYGRIPPLRDAGTITDDEHELFRAQAPLFQKLGREAVFVAALSVTLHDWDGLRPLVHRVLDETPAERITAAVAALIDAVYWAVRDRPADRLPEELAPWLLDQMMRLPDVDDVGGNVEWHLNEAMKKIGRPTVGWLVTALAKRTAAEKAAEARSYRAVSHHIRLSKHVARIEPNDANNPETRKAVTALVDLAADHGTVGYRLPEILHDVDPKGLVVPSCVVERIETATTSESLRRLARIGGAYAVGSATWRTIAKPILVRAASLSTDEQRSIFAALADRGIRTYRGTPGEVPPVFRSAVDAARKTLSAETDAPFRPLWEWRLAVAEAELQEEEERSKEERGD